MASNVVAFCARPNEICDVVRTASVNLDKVVCLYCWSALTPMTHHRFTVVRCENLGAVLAIFVCRAADSFARGHNALPPSLRSVALRLNVQFIRDLRVGWCSFVLLRAQDSRPDLAQVPRRGASTQLPIQYPFASPPCSMFFTLQTSSAAIYPRSPCVSLTNATSRALVL